MKTDAQIINELQLEVALIKIDLARKEEEKQLSFRVCEGLMENEKFYQKEFERLKGELHQSKLDYECIYDLYQEKVKELDEL